MKLFDILVEELDKSAAADALKDAFKTTSVSDFVTKFSAIASEPAVQAILKGGRTDGNEGDEIIKYEEVTLPVKNLLPTQSEIGFDQSIENILTDKFGSLASILSGKANVGGPIVTYNGKYIIDGHHRWSQVFAANPDASMEAIDLKGNLKPTEVLKVVHAAVASVAGEVPSANPKGINILDGVTEKQVLEKVNEKLSDKAKKLWAENGQSTNEEIAKLIYTNLLTLIKSNKPIPGAPGRKDMPQTDVGSSPLTKANRLKHGVVNFKNPKSADAKRLSEIAYADVSGISVGKQEYDPSFGAKTTVSSVDKETGRVGWDVAYEVTPEKVHEKLEDLIDFIGKQQPGSEMDKVVSILKNLKRQVGKK